MAEKLFFIYEYFYAPRSIKNAMKWKQEKFSWYASAIHSSAVKWDAGQERRRDGNHGRKDWKQLRLRYNHCDTNLNRNFFKTTTLLATTKHATKRWSLSWDEAKLTCRSLARRRPAAVALEAHRGGDARPSYLRPAPRGWYWGLWILLPKIR